MQKIKERRILPWQMFEDRIVTNHIPRNRYLSGLWWWWTSHISSKSLNMNTICNRMQFDRPSTMKLLLSSHKNTIMSKSKLRQPNTINCRQRICLYCWCSEIRWESAINFFNDFPSAVHVKMITDYFRPIDNSCKIPNITDQREENGSANNIR